MEGFVNTYHVLRSEPTSGIIVDTYMADRMAYEYGALLLLRKITEEDMPQGGLDIRDNGYDVVVALPPGQFIRGWREDSPPSGTKDYELLKREGGLYDPNNPFDD